MPPYGPERFLFYTGWLLLLATASTVPWWAGATIARTEFRSLTSAFACSMRWFFYSVCLLCILVAAKAFGLSPEDSRSPLLGWIHVGGTVWIAVPSAWRAFRQKGPRLVVAVAVAFLLFAALLAAASWFVYGFRHTLLDMPNVFSS